MVVNPWVGSALEQDAAVAVAANNRSRYFSVWLLSLSPTVPSLFTHSLTSTRLTSHRIRITAPIRPHHRTRHALRPAPAAAAALHSFATVFRTASSIRHGRRAERLQPAGGESAHQNRKLVSSGGGEGACSGRVQRRCVDSAGLHGHAMPCETAERDQRSVSLELSVHSRAAGQSIRLSAAAVPPAVQGGGARTPVHHGPVARLQHPAQERHR